MEDFRRGDLWCDGEGTQPYVDAPLVARPATTRATDGAAFGFTEYAACDDTDD